MPNAESQGEISQPIQGERPRTSYNLQIALNNKVSNETRTKAALAALFIDHAPEAPLLLAEQKDVRKNLTAKKIQDYVQPLSPDGRGAKFAQKFLDKLDGDDKNVQKALLILAAEEPEELPKNLTEEERRKEYIKLRERKAKANLLLATIPEEKPDDFAWRRALQDYAGKEDLNPEAAKDLKELSYLPTDETWRKELTDIIVRGRHKEKDKVNEEGQVVGKLKAPQFWDVMTLVTKNTDGSPTPLMYFQKAEDYLDEAEKRRASNEAVDPVFAELLTKFSDSVQTSYVNYLHTLPEVKPELKNVLEKHEHARARSAKALIEKGNHKTAESILDQIPNTEETRKLRALNNLSLALKAESADAAVGFIRNAIKSTTPLTKIPEEIVQLSRSVIEKQTSETQEGVRYLTPEVAQLYVITARHELGKETPDMESAETELKKAMFADPKAELINADKIADKIGKIKDDKFRHALFLTSIEYLSKKAEGQKTPEQKKSIHIEMQKLTTELQKSLFETLAINNSGHPENLKSDILEILTKSWHLLLNTESLNNNGLDLNQLKSNMDSAATSLKIEPGKRDKLSIYKKLNSRITEVVESGKTDMLKKEIQEIVSNPSKTTFEEIDKILQNTAFVTTEQLEAVALDIKMRFSEEHNDLEVKKLSELLQNAEQLLLSIYMKQLEDTSSPVSPQQKAVIITKALPMAEIAFNRDQEGENAARYHKLLGWKEEVQNIPSPNEQEIKANSKPEKAPGRRWFKFFTMQKRNEEQIAKMRK